MTLEDEVLGPVYKKRGFGKGIKTAIALGAAGLMLSAAGYFAYPPVKASMEQGKRLAEAEGKIDVFMADGLITQEESAAIAGIEASFGDTMIPEGDLKKAIGRAKELIAFQDETGKLFAAYDLLLEGPINAEKKQVIDLQATTLISRTRVDEGHPTLKRLREKKSDVQSNFRFDTYMQEAERRGLGGLDRKTLETYHAELLDVTGLTQDRQAKKQEILPLLGQAMRQKDFDSGMADLEARASGLETGGRKDPAFWKEAHDIKRRYEVLTQEYSHLVKPSSRTLDSFLTRFTMAEAADKEVLGIRKAIEDSVSPDGLSGIPDRIATVESEYKASRIAPWSELAVTKSLLEAKKRELSLGRLDKRFKEIEDSYSLSKGKGLIASYGQMKKELEGLAEEYRSTQAAIPSKVQDLMSDIGKEEADAKRSYLTMAEERALSLSKQIIGNKDYDEGRLKEFREAVGTSFSDLPSQEGSRMEGLVAAVDAWTGLAGKARDLTSRLGRITGDGITRKDYPSLTSISEEASRLNAECGSRDCGLPSPDEMDELLRISGNLTGEDVFYTETSRVAGIHMKKIREVAGTFRYVMDMHRDVISLGLFEARINPTGDYPNVYQEHSKPGDGGHETLIADHRSGLMWQKSPSGAWDTYAGAKAKIQELNREGYGGYHDWRLPGPLELLTIMQPERYCSEGDCERRWVEYSWSTFEIDDKQHFLPPFYQGMVWSFWTDNTTENDNSYWQYDLGHAVRVDFRGGRMSEEYKEEPHAGVLAVRTFQR